MPGQTIPRCTPQRRERLWRRSASRCPLPRCPAAPLPVTVRPYWYPGVTAVGQASSNSKPIRSGHPPAQGHPPVLAVDNASVRLARPHVHTGESARAASRSSSRAARLSANAVMSGLARRMVAQRSHVSRSSCSAVTCVEPRYPRSISARVGHWRVGVWCSASLRLASHPGESRRAPPRAAARHRTRGRSPPLHPVRRQADAPHPARGRGH